MPKFRSWWLLLIVPALLIALVFGVFRWVTFDHGDQLARAVLFLPNGNFDEPTLSAAFGAKFPNGTPVSRLKQFTADLSGTCTVGPEVLRYVCSGNAATDPPGCASQVNDTLYCTIPVSGTFCIANRIALKAHLEQGANVSNVTARNSSAAC